MKTNTPDVPVPDEGRRYPTKQRIVVALRGPTGPYGIRHDLREPSFTDRFLWPAAWYGTAMLAGNIRVLKIFFPPSGVIIIATLLPDPLLYNYRYDRRDISFIKTRLQSRAEFICYAEIRSLDRID